MSTHSQLKQTTSWAHQGGIIENAIRQKSVGGAALQILEAGCGQRWTISLDRVAYFLTGVDMDKAALDLRQHGMRDLHSAVVGDLRTVELPDRHYDVIYNAYVLEHVSGAEQVLKNFVRWVKPGGLIVLLLTVPLPANFRRQAIPQSGGCFYIGFTGRRPVAGRRPCASTTRALPAVGETRCSWGDRRVCGCTRCRCGTPACGRARGWRALGDGTGCMRSSDCRSGPVRSEAPWRVFAARVPQVFLEFDPRNPGVY
jgi:SAM-dependent methyltransferase